MRLKLERNGIMVADSKPFETLIEDLVEERRNRRVRSPSLPRRRSVSPRRRCAGHERMLVASARRQQHVQHGLGQPVGAPQLVHPCAQALQALLATPKTVGKLLSSA